MCNTALIYPVSWTCSILFHTYIITFGLACVNTSGLCFADMINISLLHYGQPTVRLHSFHTIHHENCITFLCVNFYIINFRFPCLGEQVPRWVIDKHVHTSMHGSESAARISGSSPMTKTIELVTCVRIFYLWPFLPHPQAFLSRSSCIPWIIVYRQLFRMLKPFI